MFLSESRGSLHNRPRFEECPFGYHYEAADAGDLFRQSELHAALLQILRCLFACGHIDGGADHLYGSPGVVVRDEKARLDPPILAVKPNNAKLQNKLRLALR